MAHRRWVLGKPSVKPISPETGIVISDISTALLPGMFEISRVRERSSSPLADQPDGIGQSRACGFAGIRISVRALRLFHLSIAFAGREE